MLGGQLGIYHREFNLNANESETISLPNSAFVVTTNGQVYASLLRYNTLQKIAEVSSGRFTATLVSDTSNVIIKNIYSTGLHFRVFAIIESLT